MNPKTILIVCPFSLPNLGGVESHIQKLTDYLIRRGHKIYLITYQPLTTNARGPKFEKRGNLEIHRIRWFGQGWFPRLERYFPLVFLYLFPGIFFKSLVFAIQRRKEIEVIHAHGFAAAMTVKIINWFVPRRTVVSTHAVYDFKNRPLLAAIIKWTLFSFNAILAVGEPSRRELVEIGLPSDKVKVHPNWIDLEIFKSQNREKSKKALDLGKFTILFVGRFLEKKGIKVLLDAQKKVDPKIEFVFIGDGDYKEEILKRKKAGANVKYAGKLYQTDPDQLKKLLQYYSGADVFAAPVQYEEGFATVYLETIACGTPVIAAERGCLPFFLNNEVAFLPKKADSENIAAIIADLHQNSEKLRKMQDGCRPYAEKHFSEENAGVIEKSYY